MAIEKIVNERLHWTKQAIMPPGDYPIKIQFKGSTLLDETITVEEGSICIGSITIAGQITKEE